MPYGEGVEIAKKIAMWFKDQYFYLIKMILYTYFLAIRQFLGFFKLVYNAIVPWWIDRFQTWRWWSISDGHQFFINSLDGHHIFKSDGMGWWTIKFLTISPSPSIYKLPSKSGLLSKNGGFFRKIWAVTLFKIGIAINSMWYILNSKH